MKLICEQFGSETLHQVCPSILKATTTVPAWKLCTETILLKKMYLEKKPWCVWVFAFASVSSSGSRKWPCLNEVSQTEGGLSKATNKKSAECKHIVDYSFMQHTPLWCCDVVCLSCFCVLQFSTAWTNNDSASCVWLYNYHEAQAYYLLRKCGGVILCTVTECKVYTISETFY